ncbi:MAG: ATP-binding protein [Candidatus Kapabacteria bacterium]|nr:ATP-binding protein [Candidatus Kapabacteria bacterium]
MEHVSYSQLFGEPFRITEPEFIARVESAKLQGDHAAACQANIDLAFARIHMGSASAALTPALEALAIARAHSLTDLEVMASLWHDAAIHFSNDRTSSTAFEKTAMAMREQGQTNYVPYALILRAREIDRVDGKDGSSEMIERALVALQDTDDPHVRVIVSRLAGMLLRSHEQYSRATTLFEEARSAAEHAGLLSQLARTISAMGSAYVADMRPKEGLTELLIALDLYERLEMQDWYVADTNLNLAFLHELAHDPRHAIDYAQRSMELFEAVGDLEEAARAENVLGALYEKCGEVDRALASYQSSNQRFIAIGSRHQLSSLPLANAANLLLDQGRSDEALGMLDEALRRAIINGSSRGQSQAYAYLGAFYDREDSDLYNPQIAEERLLRGYQLDIDKSMVSPLILEHLAKYYEHHKDFERALRFTKELYEYRNRSRDETAQRRIEQLEARRRLEEAYKRAEIEQLRNVELKAAQTLLVESEKMASLGQLTAGIAHEINNPVNFIASSIGPLRRDLVEYEALGGKGADAEELRTEIFELLNGIETGARRTSDIVKSLRTFSRLDEGSIKEADLVVGIESTLTLLGGRIKGHFEIVRDYQEIPLVECRPGEINQVIMNILTNAMDALEFTEHPMISIGVRSAGPDGVQITIADNGTGIPEPLLSKLFDPFVTTKDVGKGTGLGLSISYGIIERHRGKIDVKNHGGAVFTITLPVHHDT